MITLEEIEVELVKNAEQLAKAIAEDNMMRAFELKLQRDLLKDSQISVLEQALKDKKAA